MPAVFQFADLSFTYPKSSAMALESVSFSVEAGDSFALLGPNGAGKTTLLRLLCGRLPVKAGSLRILPELSDSECRLDLSKCGILLENPGIYPTLSIAEYLKFFAGFYLATDTESHSRGLADRLEIKDLSQRMGTLSLGTRQKVQVIRALSHRPRLLLLDEPVANLDPGSRETVWNLLADWKRETGGTLVVSSHILSEMERIATSFAIIDRGKIQRIGSVDELRTNEVLIRAQVPPKMSADDFLKKIHPGMEFLGAKVLGADRPKNPLDSVYRETLCAERRADLRENS